MLSFSIGSYSAAGVASARLRIWEAGFCRKRAKPPIVVDEPMFRWQTPAPTPNARLTPMTKGRPAQLKLFNLMLAAAMLVGTAAGVRAATATWDPNTEPDLAGYKLSYGYAIGRAYCRSRCGRGHYLPVQSSPRRYYVVVQAYNSAGDLSDKSAEVVVDITSSGGTGPSVGVQPPSGNPPFSGQPPARRAGRGRQGRASHRPFRLVRW